MAGFDGNVKRWAGDERSFGWWAAIVVQSHLRFAAGVCVIATGLFLGGAGGAIAVADADSHGSTTHDHDADRSSQGSNPAGSTVSSPPGSVSNTVRTTLQGVTGALGPGRNLGLQASTGATSPKIVPGRTDNTDAKKQLGLVAAVPNVVAQVPGPVAPVTNAVAQVPNGAAPGTNAVAQVPGPVAPLTKAVVLVSDLVAPDTNVVTLVPSLVALGFDVIVAVPEVAFAVAGGVVAPLIELPFDVLYWLVGGTEQVVNGVPGIVAAGPAVLAAPSAASPLLLPLSVAGIPAVPMVGNAVGPAPFGAVATIHLARDSSLPETAAPAPKGAGWTDVLSHFWHTFGAVVAAASLAALAAAALPGVGGLGIFTAAGARVGYRQAKAGFALQSPGIARFARPGPLGVVRSGSSVVIRRGKAGAQRLLDKAA